MVNSINCAMPVDPSLHVIAAQAIQVIEPSKPISRIEKLNAICKIYQQLIDLEEKRQKNPLCLQVNQHCFYTRYIDDSINAVNMKTYNYASFFSQSEFETSQKELLEQLDGLNADQYLASLDDDALESNEEKNTLSQIVIFRQQWKKLIDINANDFVRLSEELKLHKFVEP